MSTTVELQRLRDRVADRLHAIAQDHYLNGTPIDVDELIELEGQIRAGAL